MRATEGRCEEPVGRPQAPIPALGRLVSLRKVAKSIPLTEATDYYELPDVRQRIREYCGARAGREDGLTCEFLVGYGEQLLRQGSDTPRCVRRVEQFDEILRDGLDVSRSMWDRESSLISLDIDYQNPDFPGEPFINSLHCFQKMEPVYQEVESELNSRGIDHISVMTGKGYHFTWVVPDSSLPISDLASIAEPEPSLAAKYTVDGNYADKPLPQFKGKAFAGTGIIAEYLLNCFLHHAAEMPRIPVVLSGVMVGCCQTGREAISVDISPFGDPLYMRDFRTVFSVYQKHKYQRSIIGDDPSRWSPIITCIPRRGLTLDEALTIRTDLGRAAELAANTSTVMPDGGKGTKKLIEEYRNSKLHAFHRRYHSMVEDQPSQWPSGYDRLDLSQLPCCARLPLSYPNDLLLKPTYIQTIVRVLWSLGWEPRHIAGLLRSKYERDHGWGNTWLEYDATARANFWVRLFAGAIATGIDGLLDFNCVSQQEKEHCPERFCGHNLADYARQLLGRVN